MSAGAYHSLALKSDGTLWSWGNDEYGRLGRTPDEVSPANRPGQVGTDADWTAVSAGAYHSLALKSDGTLWSWGNDEYGRLGRTPDEVSPANRPGQVGTDADWTAVSAGTYHSLALKGEGELWSWGANFAGQLGLGDTIDRSTPVRVGTDDDWTFVSSGDSHNLALKADGTLWSWGRNYWGQLGQGDTVDRASPMQVGTDDDWTFVSSGDSHNLALKADGTLWSWGANFAGQLGLGDESQREAPTRVGEATDASALSAGYEHTIVLDAHGELWGWGNNQYGALGMPSAWLDEPQPMPAW